MALNTVTTGNTVLAADINQLVQVLQRAAGQTEVGKYFIDEGGYAVGAIIGEYMPSLSRGSTPVSVTVDTADAAVTNLSGPTTAHLSSSGFQVYGTATAVNVNCGCGGNYTIQY